MLTTRKILDKLKISDFGFDLLENQGHRTNHYPDIWRHKLTQRITANFWFL